MTARQAIEWKASAKRVHKLRAGGCIDGEMKLPGIWLLSINLQWQQDARIKSRKYIGYRNN